MQINPIGVIRSCFGGKFATPRQPGLCPSAWATLVLHDAYRSEEAIRGLDGFSHLWLIIGFHLTLDHGWHPTVRPPRLGGNQRIGVFATRSPFRPNGLGLSLARFNGIDRTSPEAPVLMLGGLDLVDGTPVFDIKPFLPYVEAPPDACGGFAQQAPPRLPVTLLRTAQAAFARLPHRAQTLIREALSLDPRPATQCDDDARVFGADLCGCNVRFTIASGTCQIVAIQPLTDKAAPA